MSRREPRHVLTITAGSPDGWMWNGHILFDDGSEAHVAADERARVIARAQAAVQAYHALERIEPETLIMDQFGEIVRDPAEYSVKVTP